MNSAKVMWHFFLIPAALVLGCEANDSNGRVVVESVAMGAKKPNKKTVVEDTSRKVSSLNSDHGPRALVTKIQTANAEVQGALSKEIVRTIVHRHIGDVRLCYEQALAETPDVAGHVAISFSVSRTGTVQVRVSDHRDHAFRFIVITGFGPSRSAVSAS